MLVLARSNGQSVVLDDRIVVTVITTRTGLVRLGIEAPDGVGVRRGELDRHQPQPGDPRRRVGRPAPPAP
ncbi:carbon storage regulator [Longivirga aurantiaca]|uniref:Carbon storage regulator n=1 Tax=Longivirga aurantiaca TaxID=1837743 RepID=A0ABW1SWE6_9ACTN